MVQVNCQILEDEPLAAELLSEYIEQIPFLKLNGISRNAIEASIVLSDKSIDLLFLDLHLPGIKGFDFIKGLINPPEIIVTSAYPQYALEGYELNILDYLIKPIDFQRFFRAVNKLQTNQSSRSKTFFIYFQENRKNIPVDKNEIHFIEGQGDYIKVFHGNNVITSKTTLKKTMLKLSEQEFIRIHKSYIVGKNKIEAFNRNTIKVLGKELPIGRSFKEKVLKTLSS